MLFILFTQQHVIWVSNIVVGLQFSSALCIAHDGVLPHYTHAHVNTCEHTPTH